MIEQTFFCALDPKLRLDYIQKCKKLLHHNGKLVGVLFGVEFPIQGPPFGGTKDEYESDFSKYFEIEVLEPCYNSIKPRSGNELFIIARNAF